MIMRLYINILITTTVDSKVLTLLKVLETQIAEFANSANLDEVAHNEPPHQDLHCLPSSL